MFYVPLLCRLVAPAQEEKNRTARPGEINPVSRSPVNPQLKYPTLQGPVIAKVAEREAVNPGLNPCSRLPILQGRQPINERPSVA
jgi:hypothetical protein